MAKVNNVIECIRCKKLFYPVTEEYAKESVERFNTYFDQQPFDIQMHFGRKASIKDYQQCSSCNGKRFRRLFDFESNRTLGITLSPIIFSDEEESKS